MVRRTKCRITRNLYTVRPRKLRNVKGDFLAQIMTNEHKIKQMFSVHIYSTGSRCTYEFSSRVNFSRPSLYCIARSLGEWSRHLIGLATRLTRSDFRLNLLLLKGQGCVIDPFYFWNFFHATDELFALLKASEMSSF